MPLIIDREPRVGVRLQVWKIEESCEELMRIASERELHEPLFQQLRTERRRCEWLVWRTLVRQFYGDIRIEYTVLGAPNVTPVPNRYAEFSVTHTDGYVAVLFADARCGIDIEPLTRDFTRVASRILSFDEQAILCDAMSYLPAAVAWCAKESVFKMIDAPSIDFLEEMKIIRATSHTVTLEAIGREFEVQIDAVGVNLMVWGVDHE